MGWFKRMRNKMKKKETGRPLRYMGHDDASAPDRHERDTAGLQQTQQQMSAAEKARIIEDERFSMGSYVRPSMGEGQFQPMSFELPRR